MKPEELHYNTLRTILGTMGLWGWTAEGTVFSGKTRTELSPDDKRLIPFFYMHIKPV